MLFGALPASALQSASAHPFWRSALIRSSPTLRESQSRIPTQHLAPPSSTPIRFTSGISDLHREAAVVVFMPDRRTGFGADLTREAFSDQRGGHLLCWRGIQVGGPRCESLIVLCRR